jgi:hypothetical protein
LSDLNKVNWKGPQLAPKDLARLLRANFPQITQTGIYNDRNVAGTNKKSSHAEGRGLDVHLDSTDPDQKLVGDILFDLIIKKASSIGVDNVIWNGQIWSTARGGPRRYSGSNAHTDHIHIEFTREGSQHKVLHKLLLDIGIIRTGLEELSASRAHIS